MQGLLKTDSVSKQESDNAAGDYEAKQATLQSSQANVKRLEELQSFQKIYAPFSGVITARNTDIGALIDSGSSGGVMETNCFTSRNPTSCGFMSACPRSILRPPSRGLRADLTLSEFPGRRSQGKLVRTANAIDPTSRTLLVEIAVDNPTGSFSPAHMPKCISSCRPRRRH